MAPCKYWRVEDEGSHCRYDEWDGILAGDTDTFINLNPKGRKEEEALGGEVENHLIWGNKVPTVFISAYADEKRAYEEAERRRYRGRQQVIVYVIVPLRDYSMKYRSVRGLADRLGVEIPEQAYRNSEYEYLFLHQIVPDAIVSIDPL
jgi:hypothetical protein